MDNESEKSKKLQSNEEVIEELTRDLTSSCIKVDESTESKSTAGDSWDIVDKEQDNDNAQNTDLSDEAIEDLLKDRDLLLSEAEQEVHFHILQNYYYYYVTMLLYLFIFLF